jgi:hypothetical protein
MAQIMVCHLMKLITADLRNSWLAGVTGGFAGGEQGVKQFAEKGWIKEMDPDSLPGRKRGIILMFPSPDNDFAL